MVLYFLNINSIGVTPLMSYIVEYFSQHIDCKIIESHIENTQTFPFVTKKKYIKTYRNSYHFNHQTRFQKIYKYIYVSSFLLKAAIIKRSYIIYSVDFHVISLALTVKKIFKKKNCKIVYHQFELIDKPNLGKGNLALYQKMKRFSSLIDLIILPEKTRLSILLKDLNLPMNKSFFFPNINAINTLSSTKHTLFTSLPEKAKIVGHIGSIGTNHYIKPFIEITKNFKDRNVYFLFVGKQNEEVKKMSIHLKSENIIFIDEVPHTELKNIYSFLDLGFILYKGIDDNFEYCAPNKLYEYWAYGVPVIAHKLKGLDSEFSDGKIGALINMENPSEIIDSIEKYLNSNHRSYIIEYYHRKYNLSSFLQDLYSAINLD